MAAYGFATRGSGKSAPVLQIDEVNGRVGEVVLGETRENVIGALGKPRLDKDLPASDHVRTTILVYPHLTINLRDNHVVFIQTDDPDAAHGDVRAHGRSLLARCERVTASRRGASPTGRTRNDPHPRCTVKVPAGLLLVRGDPIQTITLRTR